MSNDPISDRAWQVTDELLSKRAVSDTDKNFLFDLLRSGQASPAALASALQGLRGLNDPRYAGFAEPYLLVQNHRVACAALWVLCWLGKAADFKEHILNAADVGFDWDDRREVSQTALAGAGLYLRTHRDRDFAQLLIRWYPTDPDDPELSCPDGMRLTDYQAMAGGASQAMGVAVGADPAALVNDDDLVARCVARFLAERQEG